MVSPCATSPVKMSLSLNDTTEGVVRLPCSFSIISTVPKRNTDAQEYVVPKSMPIAGASSIIQLITIYCLCCWWIFLSQTLLNSSTSNEKKFWFSMLFYTCFQRIYLSFIYDKYQSCFEITNVWVDFSSYDWFYKRYKLSKLALNHHKR